ncbi:hypothetical protein ThrDRAFT_00414 [Frankia casuarinae]|nr:MULTISPECIES: hypothetical protein [Frankia]ETA04112.1 hypothetical protein CcI6DRAFT_00327 [Frankia sp. CcI6]EYT94043.1 hypothetical protein ThrDRAFT_00414 [Frankia casuarinae]KDA44668.1 hypothetical protein BMG523Draft_00518 [Frankia sp. BMG5.23]OAA28414.1 hypothetical protein AAY23_101935 [Frankia casuarinae]ORT55814.1 hypothetical protein KBI5_01700 [Frankia sp. KB5]
MSPHHTPSSPWPDDGDLTYRLTPPTGRPGIQGGDPNQPGTLANQPGTLAAETGTGLGTNGDTAFLGAFEARGRSTNGVDAQAEPSAPPIGYPAPTPGATIGVNPPNGFPSVSGTPVTSGASPLPVSPADHPLTGGTPVPTGGFPASAPVNLLGTSAPSVDTATAVRLGAPADSRRPSSLPGLLPGLPPEPPVHPTGIPAGAAGPGLTERAVAPLAPMAKRGTASRHEVSVDRRLLFAGGGLLLTLVILLGVVVFTGGDGADTTSGQSVARTSTIEASGSGGQPAGNPQEILRSLLNPVVMTGCAVPAHRDSAYADAALVCKDSSGIEVTAFHFPSQSAMDRQIGARETYYYDEGNCDDGQQSSEQWSSPAESTGGTRLCYFFAKRFYEFWTYDDYRIAFSADDQDPGNLNRWWKSFDPLRH